MSALAKILLYFAVVVLAAVFLSPPIYWLVQYLNDQGMLTALSGHPFHRFFSRTAQVAALVLLVPLLFWLGIRSPREFGLQPNPHRFRDLGLGFLIALLPVVILGGVYLFLDIYRIKKDIDPSGVLRIFVTAVVVASIEEFLFRGVLLGLASKAIGRFFALVAVSLVFAFVHFLKSAKEPLAHVRWDSGIHELQAVFNGIPEPTLFLFGFLSLFLAGLILGGAALRTRSLFLSIGIHAGWITAQQGLQWFSKFRGKPADEFLPWVGPNLVSGAVPTGLAPLIVLLLTAAAVWYYLRHASRVSRGS